MLCGMLWLISLQASAQPHAANDTILLGAVVQNHDTIPMIFLPDVYVTEKMPRRLAREIARRHAEAEKRRQEYEQLRYNVFVVYPYAVIAAEVLKDVDGNLARINDKGERKKYLKSVEKELNQRFKGKLEDLTITQGQILVKLIDRQTGKNCYSIIRELKGGFSAVIWQSVALLFSNNLRREYDPTDRDKDIEDIVKSVEAYYTSKQQQIQKQSPIATKPSPRTN